MPFGTVLRTLRQKSNLTQKQLGIALGLSESTIGMYERGHREPDFETLETIADYFNVDMDYLTGRSSVERRTSLTSPLPDNIMPVPTMRKIPLLGSIACGNPILAVENIEDEVDIPEHIHADFALRCKGDSMIGADIRDGDIVYIRHQEQVQDGQIAAVLIDEEATLKRFYFDREAAIVTLVAENPSIKPMVYHGEALEEIHVLGLAVGLTRAI